MPLEDASTPESAPAADTPATEQTPTSTTEPKSMLEAISASLDKSPPPEKSKDGDDPVAPGEPSEDAELAAAKPAEPVKKQAKAKPEEKPEAVDDDLTPPEGASTQGAKRWHKLATRVKETTTKLAETEGRLKEREDSWNALTEIMSEARVQQPQFEGAIDYLSRVNKGDLEGALKILDTERRALALALGKEVPGVDLLDDHPDLKTAVDNLEVTRERAMETANLRTKDKRRAEAEQVQRQEDQQRGNLEASRDQALADVDAFIKRQQSSDLDFAAKSKILEAEIVEWCKGLPPSQWVAQVQRMYGLIGKVAKFAPAPGNGSEPRPLRGGGGGGGKPAPKSMLEAIEQGVFSR